MSSSGLRRSLDWAIQGLVVVLMASLAILVAAGVGFRKFGTSLVWYDEVASVLLVWLTYFGASLAALRRAHIGFPNCVEALPRKASAACLLVREVIVIAFFVAIGWGGVAVMRVLTGTSLISLPWVPAALTHAVIPLGAVLFVVAEVLAWDERVRGLSKRDQR